MEVLASKLAELLQVSVDGATKAYPVLREQYIWYRLLEEVMVTAGVVFFTLSLLAVIGSVIVFVEADDEPLPERMMKICKIGGWVILVSFVIMVGSSLLRVVLAPDIMMILELL